MEIPNYDSNSDKTNRKNIYKRLYQYMPDDTFRLLICGGSGSGKTNQSVGYDALVCSNNEIVPVENMENEAQKIVIFDDFVCEKNQKPLIDYFIRGRHKNCSVIYLSQSFYGTPKDIRLNCSHFCLYEFPSSNERNLISRELSVDKEQYNKATKKPYSFLYVDKPIKLIKKNFYGKI